MNESVNFLKKKKRLNGIIKMVNVLKDSDYSMDQAWARSLREVQCSAQ